MMKRVLVGAGLVYLNFALVGRLVEAMGAVRCRCPQSCWCHRPVLSTFRWVFPFKHTPADGEDTGNLAHVP